MTVIEDAYEDVADYLRTSKGTGACASLRLNPGITDTGFCSA
jgi:hypothetical protein